MNIEDIDNRPDLFKAGCKLCIVKIEGGKLKCTCKAKIASWDERFACWRTERGEAIRPDGKGYYAMCSREGKPHFLFSANPEHIKLAEYQAKLAKATRKRKEKEKALKLNEFNAKLDALLKEYGANIDPVQLSGDDQGVELGLDISIDYLNN